MNYPKSFIILMLLFSVSLTVFAGEREPGKLKGRVIDETTQQPIVGATVQFLGIRLGTIADENGEFVFAEVPAGSYSVEFNRIGYKPIIKSGVIINPDGITNLIVEMTPQAIAMEGVDVRASYFDKAGDAIVSTRTMNCEEIREQAGGMGDIQRVMQALPAVVSASDQDNEIIVRGGLYGENLFLMDNIEVPNPNHFGWIASTGGPISMINTAFVREVDFIAGAFPAKYGDKASSVMDIHLREGSRERIIQTLEVSMAGGGGLLEGPINGGKGSYLLSARKSYLDLVVKSIGMTAVPQYYNLQGKVVYDFSPSQKLIINGIFGDDDIHIEEEETGYGSTDDMDVQSGSQRYTVGGTLKSLIGSKGYSLFTLSHSTTDWDEIVVGTNTGELFHDLETIHQTNTAKTDITYLLKKNFEMDAGASVTQSNFDHNQKSDPDTLWTYLTEDPETGELIPRESADQPIVAKIPTLDENGDPIVYTLDVKEDVDAYKYAGYLQFKYHPFARLTLHGGVRYDYFDYTENGYFAPRGGLSFHLSPITDLNFAYGRHYQSPDFSELTRNPANKHLESKYTEQYVAGIEHLFAEDFKATLEAYWKKYDDVPVRYSMTTKAPNDFDDGVYVNAGSGTAKGIELFLQKKLSQNFYGTLSYSYSVSEADDPRYPGETYDWDFDYRHVFTLITGYKINFDEKEWYRDLREKTWYKWTAWLLPFAEEVQVGMKWRYLGGRPYTPPIYHPEHKTWQLDPEQNINSDRLPAYHRLDFRWDRRFFFDTWNLVTFIEIENVYGQDNIWNYSYKEDGTKEEIYQYQTMPVGGLIIEF